MRTEVLPVVAGEEVIKALIEEKEIFWENPNKGKRPPSLKEKNCSKANIIEAEERMRRFAAYVEKVFPETAEANGIIESPLVEVPELKKQMGLAGQSRLFLKCDSHLPISGSVKARGGIHQVLKFAETVSIEEGILDNQKEDFSSAGGLVDVKPADYSCFASSKFKKIFSQYSVAVGSTGNLGLSIGIMAAQLGFNAVVYMSDDAREWKKALLRSRGAQVIECQDGYEEAVKIGRAAANGNPKWHFVDDEGSEDLFYGYATAGTRLAGQLVKDGIKICKDNPLFVYIPCGVGGAPGGITCGVKEIFGDNVYCFFAEPVKAPCMLLGMHTGLHDKISVQDIGLSGKTEADGLAVSRPSRLVGGKMENILDGIGTICDDRLFVHMKSLRETEAIEVEPSACATFDMPVAVEKGGKYPQFGTHVMWLTGGSMVPLEEREKYRMREAEAICKWRK